MNHTAEGEEGGRTTFNERIWPERERLCTVPDATSYMSPRGGRITLMLQLLAKGPYGWLRSLS